MTKLWRSTVNDTWMHAEGLGWFTQFGEPRTVDGTPMVQMSSSIVPATGWHADEASAIREAAHRIEQIGRRLLAQAETLRVKAASMEVTP